MSTNSPPPFVIIKATTSLFFLAFILSCLVTMSNIKLKRQPGGGDRVFPRPAPDAWTTTDALVSSDESRDVVPWPLRVHDTWRRSYGSLPLLRSHTKFCRVPQLHVQVDSPFRSETAMGRIKRSYVCLRFDKQCRGQEMEELWDRRYFKKYDTYQATFLMTDTTALNRLKRDDSELFDQVMWQREGEAYVSALDGGDAISGNKQKQLSVKRKYAESFGCDYNSLHIQPSQYSMSVPSECRNFFKFATRHEDQMWIMKPTLGSGGVGITLHTGSKDFNDMKSCKKAPKDQPNANKFIIQEYVKFPLLISNKKFDMRVYMLIASSNPYIIFYHKGYLRRAVYDYDPGSTQRTIFLTNTHFQSMEKKFELADHIWGWARFQKYLADHHVAGAQYVSTVLDSSIKKVMLFNFWSAKEELVRRKGSYHLFGLDFMVDDELRVHFIEANGFPGYTWSKDFPTRTLVTTLIDLIVELHEAPKAFERMTRGDTYGEFELIYNELEDGCSDVAYNPCVEFANHNSARMKQQAKRVSEIHDTGRRTMFKAKKQKERDRQKALDACRKQGVNVDSKECEQIMYEARRQRFVAYYAEVRAWNIINKFVAADLSDDHPDTAVVVQSHALRSYGGIRHFQGLVATCKTLEDNSVAKNMVDEPGRGRVLVIDGGGSANCALFGDVMAAKAVKNGWEGVVIHGSVRDTKQLAHMKLGVVALGTCPKRSNQRGLGERDVPVQIFGVCVEPNDRIHVDEDGIVIFKHKIMSRL